MKIAELLLERSAIQKRITGLRDRVSANAKVQEGQLPHENAETLLAQAVQLNRQFYQVNVALHEANLAARLPDGRSLTAAVADRDRLAAEHALLQGAINATSLADVRYSGREIRWVATLDVQELQRRADAVAETLRRLNVEIQRVNWSYDLPDGAGGIQPAV